MTTIDRLGLLGIRSYGTDAETFIKFYKPLTILLGRNGTGKSTIIEAVRMATTGDLPPFVERGVAFVHDPRIDNQTETKAKIRLMFTNVRGDQYVIVRHFQLSLKKLPRSAGYKPEFKTLDQTLKKLDHETGGSARTYRCNDLNTLLPDVMRVSKPVLNNVIFVHQEESLWPLSDSNKLKAKFDEIFSATRYTKALDIIRKYRKDQGGELKTVNVELMHYEDKVKRLESVRSEVDEIQVRHDELRRGVEELEDQIATLRQEAAAAELLSAEFSEFSGELEKLRVKGSLLEKEKAEKYAELQVHLADSDDHAIRTDMEKLQTSLDNTEEECARRSRFIDELTADIDMKRAESTQRQTRKGMLEQQAKMQRDRLEKLNRIKTDVLASHDLREQLCTLEEPLQLPTVSEGLERWSQALSDLKRDADMNVRKLTEDGNSTLDASGAHCTEVRVSLESAKADLSRKMSSVDDARMKLSKTRGELRELEQSQVSIKDAEARMRALQTAFSEKQQSGQIGTLERKISEYKKKISSAREDLTDARRARDILAQDQAEQARLEVARRSVKSSQVQLSSAIEELVELQRRAVRALGQQGVDATATKALQEDMSSVGAVTEEAAVEKYQKVDQISTKILAKRDLLIENAEREYSASKPALQAAESQKLEADRIWKSLGAEARTAKAALQKVIKDVRELRDPPEDVGSMLAIAGGALSSRVDSKPFGDEWLFDVKEPLGAMKEEIVRAQQRVSQQETGLLLAEIDLEQFEADAKHKCPACGVSSSKKVESMRTNLKHRIINYQDPEKLKVARDRLATLENTLEDMKQLNTLTAMASGLNVKFTKAKAEKNDATRRFEAEEKTSSDAERALSKAKLLTGDGPTQQVLMKGIELKQQSQAFRRAQQELDLLQSSLSVAREDHRSLADVDSQVRQLEEDLTQTQESLDRTQKSLEAEKDDMRRVEIRFHQAKQLCLEQEAKAERHTNLMREKEDLQSSISTLEEEIESHRTTSSALKAELRQAEDDFQRTRGENSTLVSHANSKLSRRRLIAQEWTQCQHEIDAYVRSAKDKELDTLIQFLEAISSELSAKTADLRKYEREQRTASDSRKEVESNLRNLRDNQKFKLLEQELKANSRSMRHLEDKLAALERRAGERPSMKVKRLTDQVNVKNAERHATMGKQQVFTERYKEKRKELTEVENEGSRRKFDECRIKKQTMQLASGDLDRYHRALDQALMAFHTLKMNSINRTIKELWQQTYRGTDIEEIEITSDHGENKGGAVRRSFNYRVQMRQGGAVLDMRGRCSSGQKVLACLVIRLALAESFCSDCGILALDEPTTNLDRQNIGSLATALKTIIELRRKQRNFQLILITHDQEFIEMLGARDICSEYYTIYKDASGVSRAKLQDLQRML